MLKHLSKSTARSQKNGVVEVQEMRDRLLDFSYSRHSSHFYTDTWGRISLVLREPGRWYGQQHHTIHC